MTPSFRKFVLTAHITSSVGWIGAIAAFLVLALTGLTSPDAQIVRTTYPAMELIARFVIVPLAFAALLSGLVQSLGTPWGLFRHYWVSAKLLLTIFATIVLLTKLPLIDYAAHQAVEAGSSIADVRAIGIPLAVHAAGGILVLLAVTILSVYKPWGLTRYGRRKQQEREYEVSNPPQMVGPRAMFTLDKEELGGGLSGQFKVYVAAGLGVLLLMVVHILMRFAGHSLHHGH